MSQSPLGAEGSKSYAEGWRAINILIRSDGSWSGRERNLCFRNRGDGTFDDASFTSGLDLDADGRAFVPLDIDSDGDLDLILKNRNGRQLRAFRNDMRPGHTRQFSVRLEGRRSNRDGVGGRVWITTDRRTMMREIASGSGYLSQRSRRARFALSEAEAVRGVQVRWPLGDVQEIASPPQDGHFALVEGDTAFRAEASPQSAIAVPEPAPSSGRQASPGAWLLDPPPAPDFELRTLGTGASARLSDHRGGPVLLNFWASWCPPCRTELASFQDRMEDFRRMGVEVVAVSLDQPETAEAAKDLVSMLGLDYSVLLADPQTAAAYSVLNERLFDRRRALAVPTTFLLNSDGRIVKAYRGEVDADAVIADIRAGSGAALPFAGRWAASAPGRDYEELAAAFAERGLGVAARSMFAEALATGARSPVLLNNFAGALITDGEKLEAERLLREALAKAPGLTDAKVNLATLLVERGDRAEAVRLLEAALNEQPKDGQALSVLGAVRFSEGRLESAETLFRRAVQTRPEEERFRANLGAALASQGRFAEALQEYEAARQLGAESAALHTNLAVLYMQTGQPGKAREYFLKAAETDPDDPSAHLNLARFLLQAGDAKHAKDSIRHAMNRDPRSSAAFALLAQALAMQGLVDQAREAAEEALRHDPNSAEAARIIDSLE